MRLRHHARPGSALATGVVVALALASAAPHARAESPDAAIARLSDVYLEHWLPRHPAEATRLGAHRYDETLPIVTEASLAEDLAWTRDLRARLDSVATEGLNPERRHDRELLRAACARELVSLEILRPWRSDPGQALPLVRDAIVALADPARGPSCRRIQGLERRLAQVPEVLRAARVMLVEPDSAAIVAAIPEFDDLARRYRGPIGASIADCNDAARQARFAEADSNAVRAVLEFARALREELLPRAGHAAAIGPEAAARWLDSEGVLDGDPRAMLARAEVEARGSGEAPAAPRGTREKLADSTAALVWLRGAIDGTPASFVGRERTFTAPLERVRPRLHVVRERRREAALPMLVLAGPGAWEPAGRGWTIEATLALPARFDDGDVADQVEASVLELARVSAWRELPSPLRQAVPWPATAAGVRADMLRPGHAAGDARDARDLLRAMLGDAPSGAPRPEPARALAVFGRWRMQALRTEARTALGTRFDPRAFDDAVIAAGDAPWPLVREVVLARLAGSH